jgi:ABC-2 type transport system permease protein
MTYETIRRTLRGAYTVWYRDLLALLRDRARLGSTIVMTAIMLVGLGFGLGSAIGKVGAGAGVPGIPYIQFAFPAFLCMTALMTAMQSTVSIVWDREFGFMRKILVAPVSRTSVALGKVAGGVTIATIQAGMGLVVAPFLGFGFHPLTLLAMLLLIVLLSAVVTAIGILAAARQTSMQAFQTIMFFVMMPMTLLSFGSLLPSFGTGVVATAYRLVSQLNPVAYGIDAVRQVAIGRALPAAMTLHTPVVDVAILCVLFVAFLAPGVLLFNKQD